jgi:hypothetical protein
MHHSEPQVMAPMALPYYLSAYQAINQSSLIEMAHLICQQNYINLFLSSLQIRSSHLYHIAPSHTIHYLHIVYKRCSHQIHLSLYSHTSTKKDHW